MTVETTQLSTGVTNLIQYTITHITEYLNINSFIKYFACTHNTELKDKVCAI